MLIGKRIKQRRKEMGFKTQQSLADALGVSHVTVSGWERDEFKPDGDKLIALMILLNDDFGKNVNISKSVQDRPFKDSDHSIEEIFDTKHLQHLVSEPQPNYEYIPNNLVISRELDAYIKLLEKAESDGYINTKKINHLIQLLKSDIQIIKSFRS